ncbi:MAG: DnaJ C-terminal domain-containing protein [Phycisphaerales bacterium]|nr:DnaJ C-terminal domain-containing protein [Phycisphaerales bacterium]
MADDKDYYDILGVGRTATDDEIRTAFRKLARRYHPDVSQEADAERRFAEAQEAYEVLSDTEKRKAYDRFGRSGVGASPGGPGGGGWQYKGSGGQQVDPADFQDIFEEMFSGGAGSSPFSGGGSRAPQPRRGANISRSITITFLTAAMGGEESIKLDDGTQVSMRIPAGIDDGGRLRVRDKGEPGPGGGPRGDLIMTVRVGKHPVFTRSDLDVMVDVPVTVVEAIRGTSISVPLLEGHVDLRIPAGSSSGRKLRIAGKGIKDAAGKQGDFYAIIQIRAPEGDTLSQASQDALDQLSGELPDPRTGLEGFS